MYWLCYCSGEYSLVLVVEATVVQVVNTGRCVNLMLWDLVIRCGPSPW